MPTIQADTFAECLEALAFPIAIYIAEGELKVANQFFETLSILLFPLGAYSNEYVSVKPSCHPGSPTYLHWRNGLPSAPEKLTY